MKAAYIGIDLLYPALPALAEAGCEIMKIFTCNTDNITEFNTRICGYAYENGIPLQKEPVRNEDLSELLDAGCELVLCGGYYYRLPVLEELRMVNIHPSLLPVGRGAWPMPVTIRKGLSYSGVTFHKLTEALDAGDILLQQRFPLSPGETLQSLTAKQQALLPGMVSTLCRDLDELWANALPQGEHFEYWPCPTEKDWTITAGLDPAEADVILRAFYGYEVIFENKTERWELIEASLRDAPAEGKICFPFGVYTICANRARRVS